MGVFIYWNNNSVISITASMSHNRSEISTDRQRPTKQQHAVIRNPCKLNQVSVYSCSYRLCGLPDKWIKRNKGRTLRARLAVFIFLHVGALTGKAAVCGRRICARPGAFLTLGQSVAWTSAICPRWPLRPPSVHWKETNLLLWDFQIDLV